MPVAGAIIQIRPDIELGNISDVGCERTNNEDYFLYIEPQDTWRFRQSGRLVLVADGMGGRNGGEVASRLAAEAVRDVFLQSTNSNEERSVLITAFQAAHRAILDAAHETPELWGMGTTCCAAIMKHGRLFYGHIGDSRIYLIRNGRAEQLTDDHNVVARMVKDGLLNAEQARNHAQRNVLTAALGLDSESVAGDFPPDPLQLRQEDSVLICTDGLHNMVTGEEMAAIVTEQSPPDACRELVGWAKRRGGPDNITVQIVRVRHLES